MRLTEGKLRQLVRAEIKQLNEGLPWGPLPDYRKHRSLMQAKAREVVDLMQSRGLSISDAMWKVGVADDDWPDVEDEVDVMLEPGGEQHA